MTYKQIPIRKLIVNPSNDRHGPLETEREAMLWLLDNKAAEMRQLASDIATQNAVYDAPLVKPDGDKFVVHDGNRRTTCVKLIAEPSKAPKSWQSFFLALNKQLGDDEIASLYCQIETDQSIIDRMLERRHNGKQDGAGQIKWDTRAKSNHAQRVGGKSAYPLAETIERYLSSLGYQDSDKIKRSNLEKLLDSKKRQKRVGVELDESGELKFTKTKSEVSKTLLRIAEDLLSGELSLKNLLLADDKEEYLDKLKSDQLDTGSQDEKATKKDQKPRGKQPKPPKLRDHLIPGTDYEIRWGVGQSKIQELWRQLQFELSLKRNTLSVAVVLRVFLEQLTTNSCEVYELKNEGKLSSNVTRLANKLEQLGVFDQKQAKDIRRVSESQDAMVSIDALQRVLHSKSHVPGESDLRALWDCLEPLVLNLIKRIKTK